MLQVRPPADGREVLRRPPRRARSGRRTIGGAAAILAAWLLGGCATAPPPVLPDLRRAPAKNVLVLVPGVTGAELRDRESGEFVWGKGKNLLRPHDGGYAMARPIGGDDDREPRLEAGRVIERVRLAGVLLADAYGPVAELLEANGYRQGDLERPDPEADFFFFSYDWRQDNTESAALLASRLERLRVLRGDEVLPVDLVCQSNGAHVCRFFVRYGGASLEEAEAGRGSAPAGIAVEKVILIGSSNGGSLRILREFNRGRRYIPWIGRHWRPETLFTVLSLYQDLPAYRDDLFLDERGEPLDVDLFDAAAWETYGWSIYGRRASARLERDRHPELFGTAEERAEFLRRALDRARRFHRLLRDGSAELGSTRYYLIQSAYDETPERAVLVRRDGRWKTLFTGDRELKRQGYLHSLASAPGDGHATARSQLYLSAEERDRTPRAPFYLRGEHFRMILDPAAQTRLLEILAEPPDAGAAR